MTFGLPYWPGCGRPRPKFRSRKRSFHLPKDLENVAFQNGMRHFDAGYFWEAHEIWEGLWRKCSRREDKVFLQVLILISAHRLKQLMGESQVASRLLKRARQLVKETQKFWPPLALGLIERRLNGS